MHPELLFQNIISYTHPEALSQMNTLYRLSIAPGGSLQNHYLLYSPTPPPQQTTHRNPPISPYLPLTLHTIPFYTKKRFYPYPCNPQPYPHLPIRQTSYPAPTGPPSKPIHFQNLYSEYTLGVSVGTKIYNIHFLPLFYTHLYSTHPLQKHL